MSEEHEELVRLLERDYDQTTAFVHNLIGVIATVRGWSVTVWLALLGFAITKSNPAFALLAVLVLFPFLVLDLYQSWLYSVALKHARSLEELTEEYRSALVVKDDDPGQLLEFEEKATTHTYGLYQRFRRFQWPQMRGARPEVVFRVFYPSLIIGAVLTSALIAIFS